MEIAPQIEPKNPDSKTLALVAWIGSIIFWFIPSLVLFLTKKDDEFVQDHAKEVLNLIICLFVVAVCLMIVSIILAMVLPLLTLITTLAQLAVGVGGLVALIMGAIKANEGKTFRVPFIIRIIK